MFGGDRLACVRAELREDLAESREQPLRETARIVGEGVVGLALLLRLVVHVLVYIAETGSQPGEDGVEYHYARCHVPAASDDVAWRARLVTGLVGLAVAHYGLTVYIAGPVVSVFLIANAAVLVLDPVSPLWLRE